MRYLRVVNPTYHALYRAPGSQRVVVLAPHPSATSFHFSRNFCSGAVEFKVYSLCTRARASLLTTIVITVMLLTDLTDIMLIVVFDVANAILLLMIATVVTVIVRCHCWPAWRRGAERAGVS